MLGLALRRGVDSVLLSGKMSFSYFYVTRNLKKEMVEDFFHKVWIANSVL